jgi:hypothetical protein
MAIAAFVLAVIGVITGVASLTWNVVSFLWTGARPKLKPIVGILDIRGGLVSADATRDIRQGLASAAGQLPPGAPWVVGVEVVNAGRAPFHVAKWELRAEPGAMSYSQFHPPMPGTVAVPCDIAPGASATFFAELHHADTVASVAEANTGKPQRVTVRVESGGRTYETDPIAAVNIALGAQ